MIEGHRFLRRGPVNAEGWSQLVAKDRDWERSYRGRWAHDTVVRSTHGVNCTGSCSWNVYVKDGLITWESQAVDYPSTGPDMPDHEPRGCPRGASFSWYTYSPGAAGGLGGFFPPLVMALVKSITGSYTLGFVLLAAAAAVCLVVLMSFDRPRARPPASARVSRPAVTGR